MAPMVGATTGTVTYQLCIDFHHPPAPEKETVVSEKCLPGSEKEIEIPVYAVNVWAEEHPEALAGGNREKWEKSAQ